MFSIVKMYTEKMKTAFEKQNSVQYIPTVLQKTKVVVKHRNIIQVNEATYLCKLCIHYLKKGRLPPMHTGQDSRFLSNNYFSAVSWPILMPNTAK